jgi:hypothetical protein
LAAFYGRRRFAQLRSGSPGLAAVLLAVGLRYRLSEAETFVSEPQSLIPALEVTGEIKPDAGPVMVSIEYEIDPARAIDFIDVMNTLRTIRSRDGAVFWGLFSDLDKPGRYIEYFMVESCAEQVRQHSRATDEDAPTFEGARRFHILSSP